MKLKKSRLFLACASLFLLAPATAAESLQSPSEKSESPVVFLFDKGISVQSVSSLPTADKTITATLSQINFFKLYNKTANSKEKLSFANNLFIAEIQTLLQSKNNTSLKVTTPSENESFVLKIVFNNGITTYEIYTIAKACPEWLVLAIQSLLTKNQAPQQGISGAAQAGIGLLGLGLAGTGLVAFNQRSSAENKKAEAEAEARRLQEEAEALKLQRAREAEAAAAAQAAAAQRAAQEAEALRLQQETARREAEARRTAEAEAAARRAREAEARRQQEEAAAAARRTAEVEAAARRAREEAAAAQAAAAETQRAREAAAAETLRLQRAQEAETQRLQQAREVEAAAQRARDEAEAARRAARPTIAPPPAPLEEYIAARRAQQAQEVEADTQRARDEATDPAVTNDLTTSICNAETQAIIRTFSPALSVYSCQGNKRRDPGYNTKPPFEFLSSERIPNEDALDIHINDNWIGLAVYDGHGGGRFVADALCGKRVYVENGHYVVDTTYTQRFLPELIELLDLMDGREVPEIAAEIKVLFKTFDESLRGKIAQSGATAGICLYNKHTESGYFIVLGDSQPVIINKDGGVETLDPHDLTTPEDVRDAWSLDHAFGNFTHKNPGTDGAQWVAGKWMSIEPKIEQISFNNAKYLVVCCDGVYEHERIKVEDTAAVIEEGIGLRRTPAEHLCKTACENAKRLAHLPLSKQFDHTTAIVLDIEALTRAAHGGGASGAAADEEEGFGGAGTGAGGPAGAGGPTRRGAAPRMDADATPEFLMPLKGKILGFHAPGFRDISDIELKRAVESGNWELLKQSLASIFIEGRTDLTRAGIDMYLPFHNMGGGLFLGNALASMEIFKKRSVLTTEEINSLNLVNWTTGSRELADFQHSGFPTNPQGLRDGTNFNLILCVVAYKNRASRDDDTILMRDTFETNGVFDGSNGLIKEIYGQNFIYCPCDEEDTISNFHKQFLPYMNAIFNNIDASLSREEQVLVHCAEGQHRSATVLFCYLKTRMPDVSCWRIFNYMRNIRAYIKDPEEVLRLNSKRNMLNSAFRHFIGTRSQWTARA